MTTDPYAVVKQTESWWRLPSRSVFHHACSLVTSQQIRFKDGQAIRRHLYKLSKGADWTPTLILSAPLEQFGLTAVRCETLRGLARLGDVKDPDEYLKVSGVGQWTVQGIKVLRYFDDGCHPRVILSQDKWIQQRIAQFLQQPRVSEQDVIAAFRVWEGHETLMSYFLWRCQASAITKIMARQPLTQADFIPLPPK